MSDSTSDGTVLAKQCPRSECGSHNRPEAQFCGQCGTTLAGIEAAATPKELCQFETDDGAAQTCPNSNCGHANPSQAKFCAVCGRTLEGSSTEGKKPKSPFKEITQPFIDLAHAPRALWGINVAYVFEGMVYFGMLGYLAIHFSDFVFQSVEHADEYSHASVMILTAGITIAMFFLGFVADKKGVRFALVSAFMLMLIGRTIMSAAPNVLGLDPPRPGVLVGDKVDLHVTELDTLDGVKAITGAAVLANDTGADSTAGPVAVDLAAGEGTLPSASLESRLVRLSRAELLEGEGPDWQVRFGSKPVTARLLMHSANEFDLQPGTNISLNRAYVIRHGDEDDEFIIRTHWLEDVAAINTFPVDLAAGDGIALDSSFDSRVVRLSRASLVEGEGDEWRVQYGDGPTTARLIIRSADELSLCAGATLSLNHADVTRRDGEAEEFDLQAYWPGSFAALDTSGCTRVADDAASIANQLVVDLTLGEGVVLDAALESEVVQLGNARIVQGEGEEWQLEYGRAPATARLLLHSADPPALCVGAAISLNSATVIRRAADENGFAIEARWPEDVAAVNTFGCDEPPYRTMTTRREAALRSTTRWPVEESSDSARDAHPVSVSELRESEDGPVDFVLANVHVTYVRNGGYFVQSAQEGAAIFALVSPLWSPLHMATVLGILFIVIGYGMYQPAAYAAVRQFTTPKTAAMGFAMLYALMNLGGWLPTFAFLLRDEDFLDLGIPGVFWVYTAFTLIALLVTVMILTKKTVAKAIATAKAETEEIKKAKGGASEDKGTEKTDKPDTEKSAPEGAGLPPFHLHALALVAIAAVFARIAQPIDRDHSEIESTLARWAARVTDYLYLENTWAWYLAFGLVAAWIVMMGIGPTRRFVARHPLADGKFFFFIFALIPVQTLFTYNWLILPQYISRAFEGWIGEYFEVAANANPILIFIAVPIIAALTQKAKVYNMMVYGTFIMAAPAFLMVIGPYPWTLACYILIMTIGEAMWQPRFLQYAAEIAPEGRTGVYMGVAQLPWFLTKVLVPWLYSGWMMDRYCPAEGAQNTEHMWLIFALIAMSSTVLLVLAKGWIGKDFKTKAA